MTATTVPTVTVPRVTLPTPTTLSGPRTPYDTATGPAPGTRPHPAGTERDAWTELIDEVREAGRYPTRREAERITRIVLSALGGHVIGDERVDLARALPEEAARVVAAQIPATRPQTAPQFVESIAARIEGATPATARWDVSSVLSVLPKLVGDDLVTRIIAQLPPGYALLFGRADLAPAP
ncbi:DUF2267 domain-containing protein [Streptomyces sp. NPDC051636]|uniref:DUF2267 domain-containing protein n=1 Tax=Streptomyces sp. NPDC051636 TaxID=3365663 RepID=UPI00378CA478